MALWLQRIFGIGLLVFGVNGFLHFLPLPEKAGFAKVFMDALHDSRYLIPSIACIQIISGMTLLLNRWAHVGLLLLLPVTFNIFMFHVLHEREALAPAIAVFGLNLFFLVKGSEFCSLFCKRVRHEI